MSGVNKIIFGDEILLDISEDTVSPYRLLKGYKAHTADGTQVDGLYDPNATNILTTRIITVNGTYEADDDRALGYSEVTVNVPGTFYKRLIEKNGTYTAEAESVDGFSEVRVDTEEAEPAEYNTTINDVLQERDLDFYTSSHVIGQVPYFAQTSCVVVYDNHIHLLGGGGNNKTKHYYLNDNNVWERVSTLPYDFVAGCAVVYENEIHIISGSNSDRKHYKWDGSTWTSVSTIPSSISYSFTYGTALIYNNEIHVFSWFGTDHYKWDGSDWISVSTLPENSVAPFCYDGYIYIYIKDESRYDSERDERLYAIRRWNGSSWELYFETNRMLYSSKWLVKDSYVYITRDDGVLYKWDFINEITEEAMMGNFSLEITGGDMVLLDNKIHAIGGSFYSSGDWDIKDDYIVWDLNGNGISNMWHYQQIYNIYTARNYANANAATVYNEELYVVGFNDYESPAISKYDGINWYHDTIPFPENVNLMAPSLLTYNGNLYLFNYNSDYENNRLYIELYKHDNNTWININNTLEFEYNAVGYCAVVYDGYIYLMIVYRDGTDNPTLLRFENNEWVVVSSIDITYQIHYFGLPLFPSLTVYDNAIHMVVGCDNKHYKWDGSEWSLVSTYPFTNSSNDLGFAPRIITYDDELQLFLTDNTHYRFVDGQWSLMSNVPTYNQGISRSSGIPGVCVKSFNGSIHYMLGSYHYIMSQETYDNCTTPGYYAKFKKVGKKCYTLKQDI